MDEKIVEISRDVDEVLAKLEWVAQRLKSMPGDEELKDYRSELMVIMRGHTDE